MIFRDAHTRVRAALDAVAGGRDRVVGGRVYPGLVRRRHSCFTLRSGRLRGVQVRVALSWNRLLFEITPRPPIVSTWTNTLGVCFAVVTVAALGPLQPGVRVGLTALVGLVAFDLARRIAELFARPFYRGLCRAAWVETQALAQRVRQAVFIAVTEENPLLPDDAIKTAAGREFPFTSR